MPFQYEFAPPAPRARGLDTETTTDQRTAQGLLLLREKLAEQIPQRTINETLLLATWNIRDFDASKYGFRSDEAMYYIAEIISHFDLVAVQDPTRLKEIELLSDFLVKRVADKDAWARNLALLGDFNIFDTDGPTFQALVAAGFFIPPQFREVTSNAAGGKHFDQMAFVSKAYDDQVVQERLERSNAGVFDFFQYVYTDEDEETYLSEMGRAYATKSNGDPRDEREKRNYFRQW